MTKGLKINTVISIIRPFREKVLYPLQLDSQINSHIHRLLRGRHLVLDVTPLHHGKHTTNGSSCSYVSLITEIRSGGEVRETATSNQNRVMKS